MITRRCVICGKEFACYLSDTKRTCSRSCNSEYLRRVHIGKKHPFSEQVKERIKSDPRHQQQIASIQKVGKDAALSLPEGQRGPQNRESMVWRIVSPDGNVNEVVNLLDWARKNYALFESDSTDIDKSARRIASGFEQIVRTLNGKRDKTPVMTYKGWSLDGFPKTR